MIATLTPFSATSLGFSPPSHRLSTRRKAPAIRAAAAAVETRRKAGRGSCLYEVLRVRRNASPAEIKAAYWSLAKLHHPDASPSSDGRDFIQIHDAYATLSDPTARASYDLSLRDDGSLPPHPQFGYNRSGFYTTRKWETDQCW